MTQSQADRHPIGLIVEDDLKRNRLTVFFRLLLAIPQAIVVSIWGFVIYFIAFFVWLIALAMGRLPDGVHTFYARFLRAATHLQAYVLLLADPWPPFLGEEGTYPVDLRVDAPEKQNRLIIFFRVLLAIPALLLTYVFGIVNRVIAVIGWFVCLFTGRMNEGMRDVSAWMLRYEIQTYAYLLLLTDRYPSFGGGPKV